MYANQSRRLLILVENKADINLHQSHSSKPPNPVKFAVDGVEHYLSFFKKCPLRKCDPVIETCLDNWRIVGIAVSGDVENAHDHEISTFVIDDNDEIKETNIKEILNERDYLAYFENFDYDSISSQISSASSEINNLLRSLDSQKRVKFPKLLFLQEAHLDRNGIVSESKQVPSR